MEPSSNLSTGKTSKARPFDLVCGPLLALLLLTGFFDYKIFVGLSQAIHTKLVVQSICWLLLIAAVILDDEGRFWRRVGLTLGAFFLWMTTAEILRTFTGNHNNSQDIWLYLWAYQAWPQWLLSIYLASALLDPKSARTAPPVARILTIGLLLFAGWQFAAAWGSHDADVSISIYRLEMGRYLVGLLVAIRLWARGGTANLKWAAWTAVAAAAAQIAGATATIVVAHFADADLMAKLRTSQFILHPENDPTWRLLYPMVEHNRLGAAMMANFFILWLAFTLLPKTRARWALLALSAPALLAAAYSLTRGSVVATVIGILPIFAVRLRKTLLISCALGAFAVVVVLPSEKRTHLLSIFKVETWKNPRGSVGSRARGWHGAILMIRDNPLSGIGYSPDVFEIVYREKYKELTGDTEEKVHSHNVLLEYGSESGIPALALYILFTLYRWSWLWRAFRKCPRDPPLLVIIGYELAMLLFNQFFFMYKGNQGFLLWALLLGSTFYCVELVRKTTAPPHDRQGGED